MSVRLRPQNTCSLRTEVPTQGTCTLRCRATAIRVYWASSGLPLLGAGSETPNSCHKLRASFSIKRTGVQFSRCGIVCLSPLTSSRKNDGVRARARNAREGGDSVSSCPCIAAVYAWGVALGNMLLDRAPNATTWGCEQQPAIRDFAMLQTTAHTFNAILVCGQCRVKLHSPQLSQNASREYLRGVNASHSHSSTCLASFSIGGRLAPWGTLRPTSA